MMTLRPLPDSWSALDWQQLCRMWDVKRRYGGNPDVARSAAFLELEELRINNEESRTDDHTGESIYTFTDKDGQRWTATPRDVAWLAQQTMTWFDFPYGDMGDKEEKDDKGNVIKERREGHAGYVNPDVGNWRDAMMLQQDTVTVGGHVFALPQVACSNLTWHQYRSLQAIAPQLFAEGITEDESVELQAQFLAYCLVPEPVRQQSGDPFAAPHEFKYNAERAETTVAFWREHLRENARLFHICFQVYHTAVTNYYPAVFPLLFGGGGNSSDPLHTALTGEVGTINAVMKYQGYTTPQEVYDTNLPIILGVLNTMTKEAHEIEKMNARIKRK